MWRAKKIQTSQPWKTCNNKVGLGLEEVKTTLACEEDAVAPAERNHHTPKQPILRSNKNHIQHIQRGVSHVLTGQETKQEDRHDSPLTGRRASVVQSICKLGGERAEV